MIARHWLYLIQASGSLAFHITPLDSPAALRFAWLALMQCLMLAIVLPFDPAAGQVAGFLLHSGCTSLTNTMSYKVDHNRKMATLDP
jgi:hypothetical protein